MAGQRFARKQAKERVGDVDAVVFFVGTSEFDQKLAEDSQVNRLRESAAYFQEIMKALPLTPFILCLNKMDVLEEKLKRIRFADFIQEYQGDNTVESVVLFIKEMLLKHNTVPSNVRSFKVFQTVATDTQLIKGVCSSVLQFALEQCLRDMGFD